MFRPEPPKPDTIKYYKLISNIEEGVIKIPKFQRDFVWDIKKTSELLDSILKGYPIGTFILWKTNERMNNIKNIGNIKLPEPPDGQPVEYVLDGQQRITSLYAAYKGAEIHKKGEKKTNFVEIFVDLTKEFSDSDEQIITSDRPNGDHVTLNDVLNLYDKRYNDLEEKFSREQMSKLRDFHDAFKSYDFSTVVLNQNEIDSAIAVFTRINTGGQELTLFEIMTAKTYDESEQFDMTRKWNEFEKTLREKNYIGDKGLSSAIVLYLMALIITETDCKRSTILKLDKYDIINIWEKVTLALHKSIDYFHSKYGITVSRLLPYSILLVPYAYFHFKTEMQEPDVNQRKFLEEFFWRISLSFRYSSAAESRLAQDIKKIDDIINGIRPTYNDLEFQLSKPYDLIDRPFQTGNSYCKAILCLISQQDPKNLSDNSKVILDNSHLTRSDSKNYHHIFPKKLLDNHVNENSLMNITLISDYGNKRKIKSAAPSQYIKGFAEENEKIEETLNSHFISMEGFGIESNDYSVFLKKRAEWVFEEIMKRIELTNTEKPNNEISELIAMGESELVEFKSTLRYDRRQAKVNKNLEYSIVKTIAAFMNTKGGTLFIGVDDNKNVLGIEADIQTLSKKNRDGFELHLIEILKKYIGADKLSYLNIIYTEIEGETICLIKVSESSEPIFTTYEGREDFFVRLGCASHPLSREDQSKYLRNR